MSSSLWKKPSSDENWLWFVEVVLVAGDVGVELGVALVGDGEGHRLMPRARPYHHGLYLFGGGVWAGLLRSWWNLQKMVALPLVGLFDESAKRSYSDANPCASNASGIAAPGAAMLVAGFQWVAEPINN